ncbi:MAG: ABC transporter ATP-binding protein [Myxococcales bacterium]|nr:ABC transporter ATP-binding protein [Myxococcales bacterium]
MTYALKTERLSKSFGSFRANDAVSVALPTGARHALIGPNGAGKTTFVNLLTGVYAPTSGAIFLLGEDVTRKAQHERVKRGVTRTYQVSRLFPGLTALEAVVLAILEREGKTRRWWRAASGHSAQVDEAHDLLRRLNLAHDAGRMTRSLPYGGQRLLEIALALATRPKVLLLDEPAAGIPSRESAAVLDVVASLPDDVTVLLIEHDMSLVFRFAQRITVLAGGRVLSEGPPAEIAADPRVREVYLGEGRTGEHG